MQPYEESGGLTVGQPITALVGVLPDANTAGAWAGLNARLPSVKVLILGGTGWLGRLVAETAVAQGFDVSCLARGTSVPDGVTLVRADRDEDQALSVVSSSQWDAVIDLGRQPGHVRRAVRDLEPVAERFVCVSTVSVYASHAEFGADEDAELHEPLRKDVMASLDEYGSAKVACEQAVLSGFGAERSAIIRPGLISGPGDPSGRTGYWAMRFARPSNPEGRVLVPDAPELPTAVIDVRDLAAWLVRLAAGTTAGIFNALGEPRLFPAHIELARSLARPAASVVLAPEDWLAERGVVEWSGPRSMPLWLADRSWVGMNARSTARARAAGLTLRPLAETLADSLAWDLAHLSNTAHGAGLSDDEERELLAELLG